MHCYETKWGKWMHRLRFLVFFKCISCGCVKIHIGLLNGIGFLGDQIHEDFHVKPLRLSNALPRSAQITDQKLMQFWKLTAYEINEIIRLYFLITSTQHFQQNKTKALHTVCSQIIEKDRRINRLTKKLVWPSIHQSLSESVLCTLSLNLRRQLLENICFKIDGKLREEEICVGGEYKVDELEWRGFWNKTCNMFNCHSHGEIIGGYVSWQLSISQLPTQLGERASFIVSIIVRRGIV